MESGIPATEAALFFAYTAFWLLVAFFLRQLMRRQRNLSERLAELEKRREV